MPDDNEDRINTFMEAAKVLASSTPTFAIKVEGSLRTGKDEKGEFKRLEGVKLEVFEQDAFVRALKKLVDGENDESAMAAIGDLGVLINELTTRLDRMEARKAEKAERPNGRSHPR